MEGSRPVVLRCYPKDDSLFEAHAYRALDDARGRFGRLDEMMRHTQAELRRKYPAAKIHRRERLAEPEHEHIELWYVYREGSALG